MTTTASVRVAAKLSRLSLCACGFPVLAEHIPLGTMYVANPHNTKMLLMICGGCGATVPDQPWFFVEMRLDGQAESHGGYLPVAIFEIDEKPLEDE